MRGDWREWLDRAKTDLDAGLETLDAVPESALLVDWAKAYGPKLIEAVQVLNEAFDATAQVIHEGSASAMAREARARQAVAEFLRGVGRD